MKLYRTAARALGLATTLLSLTVVALPCAAQDLVSDGGFESAPSGDYTAPTNIGDGWSVTVGESGVAGAFTNPPYAGGPHQGVHELILNDNILAPETSAVQQTLTTTSGVLYQLSFAAASDQPGEPLTVGFGSSTTNVAVPANGDTSAGDYTTFNYQFLAQGASTTLSFSGEDPTLASTGILLDAVSVTPAVPEGLSSGALGLAAMLSAGGTLLRQRRAR